MSTVTRVPNLSSRNSIFEETRLRGDTVHVVDEDTVYELIGGVTDNKWKATHCYSGTYEDTKVIYVRNTGDDETGDGLSAATAYETIARAHQDIPSINLGNKPYIIDLTGYTADLTGTAIRIPSMISNFSSVSNFSSPAFGDKSLWELQNINYYAKPEILKTIPVSDIDTVTEHLYSKHTTISFLTNTFTTDELVDSHIQDQYGGYWTVISNTSNSVTLTGMFPIDGLTDLIFEWPSCYLTQTDFSGGAVFSFNQGDRTLPSVSITGISVDSPYLFDVFPNTSSVGQGLVDNIKVRACDFKDGYFGVYASFRSALTFYGCSFNNVDFSLFATAPTIMSSTIYGGSWYLHKVSDTRPLYIIDTDIRNITCVGHRGGDSWPNDIIVQNVSYTQVSGPSAGPGFWIQGGLSKSTFTNVFISGATQAMEIGGSPLLTRLSNVRIEDSTLGIAILDYGNVEINNTVTFNNNTNDIKVGSLSSQAIGTLNSGRTLDTNTLASIKIT